MTIVLSANDLAGLVPMPEAIAAVRAVHAELASGQAVQPAPAALGSTLSTAVLLPMVASSGRLNLSVVKALTDAPDNRGRGLPTQRSVLMVVGGVGFATSDTFEVLLIAATIGVISASGVFAS